MTARPPMPNTADRDLEHVAAFVRPYLEEQPPRMGVRYADLSGHPLDSHLLTISRATAPAPYVGMPYRYEWQVATDDDGRTIAGPAYRVEQIDDLRRAFRS